MTLQCYLCPRLCLGHKYHWPAINEHNGPKNSVIVITEIYLLFLKDTAGSERYEAMSRIYYRGAKAAIVCYGKSWKYFILFLRSLADFYCYFVGLEDFLKGRLIGDFYSIDLTDDQSWERARFWIQEVHGHEEVLF